MLYPAELRDRAGLVAWIAARLKGVDGTGDEAAEMDDADPRDTRPFVARDLARHPRALHDEYKTSVARSPRMAPIALDGTPSEITGPAFPRELIGPRDADMLMNYGTPGESAIGERIVVHGRVLDGEGRGMANCLVEFWQANAGGRYRHAREGYSAPLDPNFGGTGRCLTGEGGAYALRTVRPGAYPWPNGVNDWRPAHIHFSVFGHGFAQRLVTQMYFEGDPMIPLCPIVRTIADPAVVASLTGALDMDNAVPMDARAYRFDIVLRGRRRTWFEGIE